MEQAWKVVVYPRKTLGKCEKPLENSKHTEHYINVDKKGKVCPFIAPYITYQRHLSTLQGIKAVFLTSKHITRHLIL